MTYINIRFYTADDAHKIAENYEGAIRTGAHVAFPTEETTANEIENVADAICEFCAAMQVEWRDYDY